MHLYWNSQSYNVDALLPIELPTWEQEEVNFNNFLEPPEVLSTHMHISSLVIGGQTDRRLLEDCIAQEIVQ